MCCCTSNLCPTDRQSPIYYLFRDHFLIVGPPENPANLSKSDDPKTIFSKLYNKAEAGDTETPVRFLSRYDKSATNIKESLMWIDIGQVSKRPTFHRTADIPRPHGQTQRQHGTTSTSPTRSRP